MWDKINEILDTFDFNRVKIAMDALDWHWACPESMVEEYQMAGCNVRTNLGTGESIFYPEYPQLLQHARHLLVEAITGMPDDEIRWSASTGGFRAEASICYDEERKEYYGPEVADVDDFAHSVDIRLSFEVEDRASY